jgi:hypothetical protein
MTMCGNPDVKYTIVDRFNRTMKSKLYKRFTRSKTYPYVDAFQKFVSCYIDAVHSSTEVAKSASSFCCTYGRG